VSVDKLIIEVAINEFASRESNPHIPYTAKECAEEALRCGEAGASIVHLHARDAHGSMISPGTDSYAETLRIVHRERPDLLLYTLDGVGDLSPQDRYATLRQLAGDPTVNLRMATIAPGSSRFSRYEAATRTIVSGPIANVSHDDARYFFELCDRAGVAYGVVVREPGIVRSVVAYHRAGWIRGHVLFKLNLGDDLLWGLPPSPEAVEVYLGLVPADLPHSWMTYTYGPSVWAQCEVAIDRGGHVRVGIGDNPVEADGSVVTNVDHVRRVVTLAERMGREVASPTEALAILGGS